MIAEITWIHWTAFILAVILFLAMDLGLFHRKAHAVKFKEAVLWTAIWVAVAMGFAWGLNALRGQEEALEFLTGYMGYHGGPRSERKHDLGRSRPGTAI